LGGLVRLPEGGRVHVGTLGAVAIPAVALYKLRGRVICELRARRTLSLYNERLEGLFSFHAEGSVDDLGFCLPSEVGVVDSLECGYRYMNRAEAGGEWLRDAALEAFQLRGVPNAFGRHGTRAAGSGAFHAVARGGGGGGGRLCCVDALNAGPFLFDAVRCS
jgi:hypothetical protein